MLRDSRDGHSPSESDGQKRTGTLQEGWQSVMLRRTISLGLRVVVRAVPIVIVMTFMPLVLLMAFMALRAI